MKVSVCIYSLPEIDTLIYRWFNFEELKIAAWHRFKTRLAVWWLLDDLRG